MNYKKLTLITAIALSHIGIFADNQNIMSTQLLNPAPVIDGNIGRDEWKNAAQTFGSRIINSIHLEPRNIIYYFGCSDQNLYFACKSELPPGNMQLISRVRKRDGRVFADDAVELILQPPHGRAIYQTIVNSIGTLFDQQFKSENGGITISKPLKWTPNTKVSSRMADGFWCLEMAIPLQDIGLKNTSPAGKWKVQMTRDWKQPTQWTSWNKSRAFCAPETMGEIIVSKQTPVIKFKGLGPQLNNGKVQCVITAYNPTAKSCKITSRIDITSITAPRVSDEEKIVQPGEAKEFKLLFNDSTKATYECKIAVRDLTTKQTLFADHLTWKPAPGPYWRQSAAKQTTLDFSFYPYRKTVKAKLDLEALKNKPVKGHVKFYITGPDGKTLAAETIKLSSKNKNPEAILQLHKLQPGNFKLYANLVLTENTKPLTFERNFVYDNFPWEHNNIGKEDIIVPPFKALQVDRNHRTVSALMTGYRIKNGFWDAIYAQGENILAAPIRLVLNDGKTSLRETEFNFTKLANSEVTAQTLLQSEMLTANIKQSYDYDGMCKLNITLTPKGSNVNLQSAFIELPLKPEIAKLMHATNNNMRYNPSQYIPNGKNLVWDSRMAKENPDISGNFLPYMWLGYVYKGLAWFSASDKNWSVDRKKAALEIIRRENRIILKINIVNKPFVLSKPVSYVMGFQPTPVKPRMKGWRRLCEHWRPKEITHARKTVVFAGNGTYGCREEASPWPMNQDYSIVKLISKPRRKEPVNTRLQEADKFLKKHFSPQNKHEYDFIERHLIRGVRYSKDCDYAIPYINSRASSLKWKDYQVYLDEWWGAEYRANMDGAYNNTFSASNQDMRLYYAQKLVQAGMDGIYYDNIRDWPVFDPVRGPAYKLPDGRTQPFFDIFELREFLKRTAVMLYVNKKTFPDGRPVLMAHMTNTNIIPLMSFCNITLDMEAWYGASDFQTRFSEGYILTEALGTQTGCIPEVLVKITGNDKLRISRTFIATALAFDFPIVLNAGGLDGRLWSKIKTTIMKFGYGSKAVEVFACWDKKNPIKALSGKTKCSLYLNKQKKQAIVVVSDFGSGGKAVVDIQSLNFKSPMASNLETGKPVNIVQNKLETDLKKHDFKLIMLKESQENTSTAQPTSYPASVNISCGKLNVRLGAATYWNINRIKYANIPVSVDLSGAYWGTVFLFPDAGFIGSGHNDNNETEKVIDLKMYVDGKYLAPGDVGKEKPVICSNNFKMEKTAMARSIRFHYTLEIKNNKIFENCKLTTDKDTNLKLMYNFMHPWSEQMTDYYILTAQNKSRQGTFKTNNKFPYQGKFIWAALYNSHNQTGVVSKLTAGNAAILFLWDRKQYKKTYLCSFLKKTFRISDKPSYSMTTAFFQAPVKNWQEAAVKTANQL